MVKCDYCLCTEATVHVYGDYDYIEFHNEHYVYFYPLRLSKSSSIHKYNTYDTDHIYKPLWYILRVFLIEVFVPNVVTYEKLN